MQEIDLLKKIISDKSQIRYKIVWIKDVGLEIPLAIRRTKQECKEIIKDRKELWTQCVGHDITSELQIIEFKLEEK